MPRTRTIQTQTLDIEALPPLDRTWQVRKLLSHRKCLLLTSCCVSALHLTTFVISLSTPHWIELEELNSLDTSYFAITNYGLFYKTINVWRFPDAPGFLSLSIAPNSLRQIIGMVYWLFTVIFICCGVTFAVFATSFALRLIFLFDHVDIPTKELVALQIMNLICNLFSTLTSMVWLVLYMNRKILYVRGQFYKTERRGYSHWILVIPSAFQPMNFVVLMWISHMRGEQR